MATHFSTIGFALETPEDFRILAAMVTDLGEIFECPAGRYVRWAGDCGAELWVQYNSDGRFLDIQPHFSAQATMRIGVTTRLPRPTDTALDGAWQGWADPVEDEDPSQGRYLLTFEAPDFALHHDLPLPILAGVQLAAFAHRLDLFESEDAFYSSPLVAGRLNAQAFIPSAQPVRQGGRNGPETEPLSAEALVCGHILKTERLINDLTGRPFYWLLLETDGGRIDLLADPELVTTEPQTGGVAMTVCWLSGRIL
ncbi:MAG: hypothetical protein JWM11_3605 [Planctomycetaceae bacterium]|nr:hypothetical protein [Planctomycetaceae bacterium]